MAFDHLESATSCFVQKLILLRVSSPNQFFFFSALGLRPRPPKENIESTLIWYKNSNQEDIMHWVNQLTTFIKGTLLCN